MNKKLLALLLAAGSFAALAEDNNLYVGVGAGAAWNDIQSPAASFRLDGGYKWNQYWAMEVGTTGVTQSGSNVNQSVQFYDLSLKGTLPIGDTVGLFMQVGGAYASPGVPANATQQLPTLSYPEQPKLDYLKAGWDAMFAVGMDVNLTSKVSLNVSDIYYVGDANPQGATNALLGGVKFSF